MSVEMHPNRRTAKLIDIANQIGATVRESTNKTQAISKCFTEVRNAIRETNIKGHTAELRFVEYQEEIKKRSHTELDRVKYCLSEIYNSEMTTSQIESSVKKLLLEISNEIQFSQRNSSVSRTNELKVIEDGLSRFLGSIYPATFYKLVLTDVERKIKSDESSSSKRESSATDIAININRYLILCERMLMSERYEEVALGIALSTGRRMSEVIYASTMEVVSGDEDKLMITGLLKKNGRESYFSEDKVTIETLLDPFLITTSLDRLRSMPKVKSVIDEINKNNGDILIVNKRLGVSLNRRAKAVLPVLSQEVSANEWKFSDSRSIAWRATWFFEKPNDGEIGISEIAFAQDYLGHEDMSTSEHYRGYKFYDEKLKKNSKVDNFEVKTGLSLLESILDAEENILTSISNCGISEKRILNAHDRLCNYLKNNPNTKKITAGLLQKQKTIGGVGAAYDTAKAYFSMIEPFIKGNK
jgi:hypothetical protein